MITASTEAHGRLVLAAIERGLPTFCEKPLAFDLDETVRVVDQVEATGAVVQVGFQRRFDPAYREARRLIASGELGTVYLVRLIAHDHEPPPEAYIPLSGGLFRDSSIHDIDASRGSPDRRSTRSMRPVLSADSRCSSATMTSTPGRSS